MTKHTQQTERIDIDHWAEKAVSVLDHSQKLVNDFWSKQLKNASGADFQFIDPFAVGRAFMELGNSFLTNPAKLENTFRNIAEKNIELFQATLEKAQGREAAPVAKMEPGDRRFSDPAWVENFAFDYIRQSYLITSEYIREMVHDIDTVDPETHQKVDFYTRQFLNAVSPSNFIFTNPQVLNKIKETGGENLIQGLENLLRDLEKGQGRLKITMADENAFQVGVNIAHTPGKVIFQNEMMQLIQYTPQTKTVHKRPILFVPPWINKFYVMDLQEKNSFINWTVNQGHTVFVISWVNPRKELAHKSFENYMLEGPLAALDVIEKATGEKSINMLGFCIGGILSLGTLAYMAAKKDRRIHSCTLLATMVDLTDIGEASVFIDEPQMKAVEKHMSEKGYLEGRHMSNMFAMLRENDLIWSFVINNYMMGRSPMQFDLLYWNSDTTRLPATMMNYYLRNVYKRNGLVKPNTLELDGVPIDIRKIKTPCYFIATKDDHIAPWKSTFPASQYLSGPVRFVLGGSGHIAGIINPPASKKYGYWTNTSKTTNPDKWLESAKQHEGSWWTDWIKWLGRRSGPQVKARKPGGDEYKPIEDAPGSFVKVRISD